jgi:molybdenum cofactor cytidylyltransferase
MGSAGSKMLVRLGGQPLVARAARTAVDAGLFPVLAVVGHDGDRVRAALAGMPVSILANPDPARGMHTSIAIGAAALAERADALIVMLGDMPLVTADMVRQLVARWATSHPPLAVSLYGDVVAPPILYDRRLFAELQALEGEGCGKRVVKRHRDEAVELRWPESALTDLDEPADVARAERLLLTP